MSDPSRRHWVFSFHGNSAQAPTWAFGAAPKLSLVQLTLGGGALEFSVVDDNDDAIDVMVFEAPTGWDPTQQMVEFRAGATLADIVPGALRLDLVSVC